MSPGSRFVSQRFLNPGSISNCIQLHIFDTVAQTVRVRAFAQKNFSGSIRVKPASFAYHVPKSLDEALAVLAEVAPRDGRVIAGGQSLVPAMAFRLARPEHLVDIN